MASFYVGEHLISTMNAKTDASQSGSLDGASDDFVAIPRHQRPEGVDAPVFAYSPDKDPSYKILRMGQTPGCAEWIDANVIGGSPVYSPQYYPVTTATRFEDYAKSAQAETSSALRKCEDLLSLALLEKQRLQEALDSANAESSLAKEDLESMRSLRNQDKEDLKSLRSLRDKLLEDFLEAKAQLAAMESPTTDHDACQTCRYVVDENLRILFKNKDLEAQLEQSARDAEKAQESIVGGNNTFAVIDKVIAEQKTEIAEQKTEIAEQKTEIAKQRIELSEQRMEIMDRKAEIDEHKAEIARLNTKVAELQVSQPSTDSTEEKGQALEESIEHSEAVEHCTCNRPLVVHITVWVGGVDGKGTELALVKMDPDTPFKAVLKDLRRHHPLKVLVQKSTGRHIFDSDAPSDLAMKDGEELDFIQQCGEPLYMFDATMDGAKSWRGKDSRI